MAEKQKRMKIKVGEYVTPVGVTSWPKLIEPTTRFKPQGVYETKLIFDNETGAKIQSQLEKLLDAGLEKLKEEYPDKAKRMKKADLPLTPEYDDDGDETGNMVLKVSRDASGKTKAGKEWKAKLKFADSKGGPVKAAGLSMWSGSEVRIYCSVMAYFVAKDNTVGIKLEPDVVQIKKLVSGGSGANHEVEAMDDDDGFVADEMGDIDDDTDTSDDADESADF